MTTDANAQQMIDAAEAALGRRNAADLSGASLFRNHGIIGSNEPHGQPNSRCSNYRPRKRLCCMRQELPPLKRNTAGHPGAIPSSKTKPEFFYASNVWTLFSAPPSWRALLHIRPGWR